MAEIVGTIVEVWKCIAKPIKRELSYLLFYRNKMQAFQDETGRLRNAKDGVQRRVDAAERNAEQILLPVRAWIEKVDETHPKFDEVLETNAASAASISCLNLKSRYVLGKKAVRFTEDIKRLLADIDTFKDHISVHCLPVSMGAGPPSKWTTVELGSREAVEENVMKALEDDSVNVVGIHGLGGVGKTTMAERIKDRVRSEKLFNEVVKVVVGQELSIAKIQGEFAELLGMRLDVESLEARENALKARLQAAKGHVLVIFDDVWEAFDLDNVGINWATCQGRVKVILTSRNEEVCRGMDSQEIFRVNILPPKEAWDLFREKAGDVVDSDADIHSLAKDVTKECNGLPLALITVGKAFKDKPKYAWEDALQQLRDANPADIPKVLRDVYQPLRLSYDHLKSSPGAQSLFLLCGMFPEDYDISRHVLSMLCFGLRMFGEVVMDITGVRNRAFTLIDCLKNCSLLSNGSVEEHVRMHDVVRDMAIYVASKEAQSFSTSFNCMDWLKEISKTESCRWISLIPPHKMKELPLGLHFPHLRLLMMRKLYLRVCENTKSGDGFFAGMQELNVLSIVRSKIRSLSPSMQSLKNLRTLRLEDCDVECISIVGKLTSLEILSCYCCRKIRELTSELKSLSCLRLLEMNECPNLSRIAHGVISSMTSLEELRMGKNTFGDWELEVSERNVSLQELELLTKLTCLHIRINRTDLAASYIKLPPNVNNFVIRFHPNQLYDVQRYTTSDKCIALKLECMLPLGDWVCKLLSRAERLHLNGDGSVSVNFAHLDKLVDFYFENCSVVKKLVDASDWRLDAFRLLEKMSLKNLRNLEQICEASIPTGSSSFTKLRELSISELNSLKFLWTWNQNVSLTSLQSIRVDGCPSMASLFPVSVACTLSQLETLSIWNCDEISELFVNDGKHHHLVLPKLKRLILRSLPRLKCFSSGTMSLNFPQLTSISVTFCPKLTIFAQNTGDEVLCQKAASALFTSLQFIIIRGHNSIQSLLPLHMALQLVYLHIYGCESIKNIFYDDDIETRGENSCLLFRRLEELSLESLPNLTSLSDKLLRFEFPKLRKLSIEDCPNLTSFMNQFQGCEDFNHKVAFQNVTPLPRLESITVRGYAGIHNLLPSSTALQLKSLEIDNCENLHEIFYVNVEGDNKRYGNHHLLFPKLRSLTLRKLSNLKTFGKGVRSLEFLQLKYLRIENCPNLTSLVDKLQEKDGFFCQKQVTITRLERLRLNLKEASICSIWNIQNPVTFFGGLWRVEIIAAKNVDNLFSSSIAMALVRLKQLSVEECEDMMEIITDEELVYTSLFPNLKSLALAKMPKLEIFCGWKHVELAMLEDVTIFNCPFMRSFTVHHGSVATPKLRSIEIDGAEMDVKDLNAALHRNHSRKPKDEEAVIDHE